MGKLKKIFSLILTSFILTESCFLEFAKSDVHDLNNELYKPPLPHEVQQIQFLKNESELNWALPIQKLSPFVFRQQLVSLLSYRPVQSLNDTRLQIAGDFSNQNLQALEDEYQKIADEVLSPFKVKLFIKFISVPKYVVHQEAKKLLQSIRERISYFNFSYQRDYQQPIPSIVLKALMVELPIESFSIWFLYSKFPVLDATVTTINHLALLWAYTYFVKSISNWIIRVQTNDVEKFLKSLLLGLPFVLNYSVFTHITPMFEYFNQHSLSATLLHYPGQLFSWSQAVTLLIQSWFYNLVINQGIQKWASTQVGEEKNMAAQQISPFLQAPFKALDAYLLAMSASGASMSLMNINEMIYKTSQYIGMNPLETHFAPIMINNGFMLLTGATLLIGYPLKYRPQILNATLPLAYRISGFSQKRRCAKLF